MKKYKGKPLKDKKMEGDLLKDDIEGEILKDKIIKGDPLWKDKNRIDEKKYRKENLNE